MDTLVLMLIFWFASAPLSYLILREDHAHSCGRWTQFDRVFWLSLTLLYGPIMLIVIGGVGLVSWLSTSKWGKREAKW